MLKELFPDGRFGYPATTEAVASVESILGVSLPSQLRALYLEADGFREAKGNSKYLLSLTEEDFIGSLLTITKYHWQEATEYWPELDLKPFVFFGMSNSDEAWGISWNGPPKIIAFHHHMEGEYEVVGSSILDVYKENYAQYEK